MATTRTPRSHKFSPFDQLAFYTLSHPDPSFIHQHAVDAHTAQTATAQSKPIAVTFALVGLYLHVEKGFTGKQVQQAHMRMARREHVWPTFDLPKQDAPLTVADVLSEPPGEARVDMIHTWCASVWASWAYAHHQVVQLASELLDLV